MKEYRNVKKEMLESMFVNRTVLFDNDLFFGYYDMIFPEKENFIKFLNTSGKDQMMKYAKRIVDRLVFDSPWNGIQDFYYNLMNVESKILAEENREYIQQDHSIHSVQMYLLGIYLYFNYSIFNEALNKYFLRYNQNNKINFTNRETAFLNFLEAWKSFSILHDIGYPLEILCDKNGKIKKNSEDLIISINKYNDILYYYLSIKCYAQLLFIRILIKDSNKQIDNVKLREIESFISQNHATFKTSYNMDQYIHLKYISSNEDYIMVSSWLNITSGFIIIRNKDYEIIGLGNIGNSTKDIISNELLKKCGKKIQIQQINHRILKEEKYHCEYYVYGDLKTEFLKLLEQLNLDAYCREITTISENLLHEIGYKFVMISQTLTTKEIIYDIYKIVMQNFKISEIHDSYPIDTLQEDKILFVDTIKEEIAKNINSNMIITKDKNNEESIDIHNTICRLKQNNYNQLFDYIEKQYYCKKDSKNMLRDLYFPTMKKIFNALYIKKDNYEILKIKNRKVDLLKNNFDAAMAGKIEEHLKNCLFLNNDENISEFLNYNTNFSKFDHGIVAGEIMLAYFLKIQDIKDGIMSGKLFLKQYSDQVIAESIFAVLVHNIYTDRYSEIFGKKPRNDLLINPFSYFGMFCDNLQVWDRNKSINYGLVKWEGNTLYGENISLNIEDNKIRILCQTDDIKYSFTKLKDGLKDYLTGADKMISLELMET